MNSKVIIIIVLLALVLIWGGYKLLSGSNSAYERGMHCLEAGHNQQAVTEFTIDLQKSPNDLGALCNRASAYDGLNDYPHAEQDLNSAIHLAMQQSPGNPMNSELYYNRGVLQDRYGHFAEAIADYRQAIHLRPEIEDAHNNLANILATRPGATREDGKEAVVLATTACNRTRWKECVCLDTLASAYARAGDFDKAIIWENKSITLNTDPATGKDFQQKLLLYKAGKPYTDTSPKPAKYRPGRSI